jgi:hypothetical protein
MKLKGISGPVNRIFTVFSGHFHLLMRHLALYELAVAPALPGACFVAKEARPEIEKEWIHPGYIY